MSIQYRKGRFIASITLLLVIGFCATSIISYLVANQSLAREIRSNALPLTSDNIYSEIQRDLLPPIFISSLMAEDTFVRDWVIHGEQDSDKIVRYLRSIQQRYNTDTAFFISEKTRRYYHSSGILKILSEQDPLDKWYFRVSHLSEPFEINLDIDTANPDTTTVFINHQVYDFEHRYLGAIGVGLSSQSVKNMIERYQQRFDRQVYFTDPDGNITLAGSNYQGEKNIHQTRWLKPIATQALGSTNGDFSYQRGAHKVFLNTRYVPEFKWYLFVEQQQKTASTVKNSLWINLAISLAITLIVLTIASLTFNSYQRRLEEMATKDLLTGTSSRRGLELIFHQIVKSAERRKEAISAIMVDIDHFKQINDQYGHVVGDQVIRTVANIMKDNVRTADAICRWGGEEFLILLSDCQLNDAIALAEKVRQAILAEPVLCGSDRIAVTASFGVCLYRFGETQSQFIERADQALYRAKNKGRNRVAS